MNSAYGNSPLRSELTRDFARLLIKNRKTAVWRSFLMFVFCGFLLVQRRELL